MEMWVKIGDKVTKFQGSMYSVVSQLVEKASDAKDVKLMCWHAGQKERRRLKREFRAAGRDLVKMAVNLKKWFESKKTKGYATN